MTCITSGGKMLLDLSNSLDVAKANAYLNKLISGKSKCELKKVSIGRTLSQNNYLHACLALFSGETGYTLEEAKEMFSHLLPDMMRYTKKGMSFRRSTADLDTKEMTILIDKIRETALENLGLYIPDATEYLVNRFRIHKEIQSMGVK
jgi:hypothetical protein